jgi:hypothetical protein
MPSIHPESLLSIAITKSDPVTFIQAEEIVVTAILIPEDNTIKIFPAERGQADLKIVITPQWIAIAENRVGKLIGPHGFIKAQICQRVFPVSVEHLPLLRAPVINYLPSISELPWNIMIFRKAFCGKVSETAWLKMREITECQI